MRAPRIALFDIETSPLVGLAWNVFETNIIEVLEDWRILCFSYKWLGEKKIHTVAIPDFPAYKKPDGQKNDRHVVEALWKLFDEADILVAHNGDRFDIKKANTRFLYYNLRPPSPAKSVDTLKYAKRFGFTSNKLDSLGGTLDLGRKLPHTGKHLWLGCDNREKKSWDLMCRYNRRDVELLEKLYLRIRPWAPNHPNLNLYTEGDGCPTCGYSKLKKDGVRHSQTRTYQQYKCLSPTCGKYTKGELVKA